MAQSGPCLGSVVNPDSGAPLIVNDERVLATEFDKIRRSEILGAAGRDRGGRSGFRSIALFGRRTVNVSAASRPSNLSAVT